MRTRAALALALVALPLAAFAGAPAKSKATPTPAPIPHSAEQDQFLADAKHKMEAAEYVEARDLFRQAIELGGPADVAKEAKAGLENSEKECLASARHHISEAKMYSASSNNPEALKSLELALKYADQPQYKENKTARDLMGAIKRETER